MANMPRPFLLRPFFSLNPQQTNKQKVVGLDAGEIEGNLNIIEVCSLFINSKVDTSFSNVNNAGNNFDWHVDGPTHFERKSSWGH